LASRRLEVVIAGDASGAQKAFRQTEHAASGFGSKMAGVARTVGTVGLAAAAGLGAIGVAAGGWGLKLAAENETAAVSFELLLGSGEKAKAFLEDLQAFAAKTPFELPELKSAASRLLAVGTEADKVIPIMETLGDATAGLGTGAEGINRAVTALTQMEQKGKVTAEEMMQLTEAGIPAWDALAAVMGTDVAGAQEAVSTGTVKATELFKALEQKAGPALGRLTGLMEKQSETLQGMLSTLKDTVGQNLAKQLAPLAETIKGLLPDITELAGGLAESFGGAAADLAGPLIKAFSALGDALGPIVASLSGGFVDVFAGIADGFKAAGPGVAAFVKAFSGLGEVVGPIAEIFGEMLGEVGKQLAPVLEALVEAVKPLVPILGDALLGALKALRPIWPVFADAIKELAPLITKLADSLGKELVDVFKELVPVMVDNAPAFIDLATAMTEMLIAVTPMIGPLAKLVTIVSKLTTLEIAVVAKLFGLLADAIGAVTRFDFAGAFGKVQEAVSGFARAVGQAIPGVISWFQQLPGRIASAVGGLATTLVPKALEMMAGFFTGLVQGLPRAIGFMLAMPIVLRAKLTGMAARLIPQALQFIGGFITGMLQKLPAAISFMVALPGRLSSALAGIGARLVARGVEAISGIITGIVGRIPAVMSLLQSLPGRFAAQLGNIGSLFVGVGRSIVQGIWSGISGMGGWLAGRIKSFIGGIVGGFLSGLGIGSPSKVMAEMVGKPIAQGIGVGMTEHMPDVPLPGIPSVGAGGGMALAGGGGATHVTHNWYITEAGSAHNTATQVEAILRREAAFAGGGVSPE
jgi:tape measure domain-containing protein